MKVLEKSEVISEVQTQLDDAGLDVEVEEVVLDEEKQLQRRLRVQAQQRRENAMREINKVLEKYRVKLGVVAISPGQTTHVAAAHAMLPGWTPSITLVAE